MTFRSASPLKIAVLVLAAIILAFLVFVLCLTQPRWGTPFANWSLKVWGPEDARVDSAHLKFPQITTVGDADKYIWPPVPRLNHNQLRMVGWTEEEISSLEVGA